jgi:DNA-binding transcriptional ArsR family regulator
MNNETRMLESMERTMRSMIYGETKILVALHNIEDRLMEITEILRMGNKEAIEGIQRRALAGSPLRKKIYSLCDGSKSVGQIARTLDKSIQQISNNVILLQEAGLIKEVRVGKEKFYDKTR